jgi:hypothetical protein
MTACLIMVLLVGLMVILNVARKAPEGYEDKTGWHPGSEPDFLPGEPESH